MVTGADGNGAAAGLLVSEPPQDVVQSVSVAQPPALAAAAADAGSGEQQQLAVSEAPPDVLQSVEVAAPPPALAASLAEAGRDLPASRSWVDDVQPLDAETAYRIVRGVAMSLSGDALYSAVSTADAATLGLRFGIVLWTQASRHFGSALKLMQGRDPARFAEVFGPAAGELLAVTGATDPAARLAPVAGEPLTSPAWVERFRAAGAVEAFQAAQNEEAIEHQLRPIANVAAALGQTDEGSLAIAYDLVVRHGLGGGVRRLLASTGPSGAAV